MSVVIIGGGVAGLSAANRLADLGVKSLLIEGGSYPTEKVCGEFLSPECLPILEEWEIAPKRLIQQIQIFQKEQRCLDLSLSPAAGSLSRSDLEIQLVKRARRQGVEVLTETRVEKLIPPHSNAPYQIHLSNGSFLEPSQVVLSTGRLLNTSKPPLYIGLKAHFQGIEMDDRLEMHLFPSAYVGISPVGKDIINIAMLGKSQESLPETIQRRLKKGKLMSPGWLKVAIPPFHHKAPPKWPRLYCIGDAAATIPPITGDGVAMAITSGCLAAEYVCNEDVKGFNTAWLQIYHSRLRWGRLLHRLLMQPIAAHSLMAFCRLFPMVPQALFHRTRGHI